MSPHKNKTWFLIKKGEGILKEIFWFLFFYYKILWYSHTMIWELFRYIGIKTKNAFKYIFKLIISKFSSKKSNILKNLPKPIGKLNKNRWIVLFWFSCCCCCWSKYDLEIWNIFIYFQSIGFWKYSQVLLVSLSWVLDVYIEFFR